MNLKARFFALALAAFGLVAAAPADAAPRHKSRGHAAKEAPSFPMKPDEYKQLVEKRIDKVREAIDKKLDRRGVSADRKKAIHKIIDEEAKDIRAEVAKVSADGTVTEAEAGKVKVLTNGLRARVRERLRAEKDPKAKATLDAIRAKEAKEKADKEKAQKATKDAAAKAEQEKAVKQAAAKEKAAKEAATKAAKTKAPKTKAAGQTKPAKVKAKPAKAKKKPAPSASPTAAEL
jgi:hypothetical protein